MAILQVDDLKESRELDEAAYREVCGGWAGFLSGLFAPSGGSMGVTNNLFIDYDVNNFVFQQNPINLSVGAGDNSIVAIESLNIAPISAASPMTFVYGGSAT